jgi:hypothetical protein
MRKSAEGAVTHALYFELDFRDDPLADGEIQAMALQISVCVVVVIVLLGIAALLTARGPQAAPGATSGHRTVAIHVLTPY